MNTTTYDETNNTVNVSIPMKLKRRSGRKVILAPEGLGGNVPPRLKCNEPLAHMVARAYHWQELLFSGRYASITELANKVGFDRSYVARVMRLTLLAPDIVESILHGNEPSGLTYKKLTSKPVPILWKKQRDVWGFDRY